MGTLLLVVPNYTSHTRIWTKKIENTTSYDKVVTEVTVSRGWGKQDSCKEQREIAFCYFLYSLFSLSSTRRGSDNGSYRCRVRTIVIMISSRGDTLPCNLYKYDSVSVLL